MHTSFEDAYTQHLLAVSSYLSRRVERRYVEDLAADVFAVAWQKRESVKEGEELPWLYRIAANLVSNHRRRLASAASVLHLLRTEDSAPSPADLADADLASAWRQLKPRDREVLALAVLEDLPIGRIAIALGVSPNAVSIRLHRSKKMLVTLLERERSDPGPT